MILSNFAYLKMSNRFQPVIHGLLDLSLLNLKAGIQTSAHPLETVRSWNARKCWK